MPKTTFVREATGLVRELSLIDGLMYNLIMVGPIGFALGMNLIWYLSFPGVDPLAGLLVALPLYIFGPVMGYAMLTASMPRSGGDYVFVSRIVHPAVGFIVNFAAYTNNVFGYAVTAAMASGLAFTPSFYVIGVLTNNSWMIDVAGSFATPGWALGVAFLFTAAIGALMIASSRLAIRFQNVAFIIGMVSVAVVVGILLTTGRADFVTKFDGLFGAGAYQGIIQSANAAGFSTPVAMVYDARWLMVGTGIAMPAFGATYFSTYIAGEIKGAGSLRRQLIMMPLSTLMAAIVFLVVYASLFRNVGYDFLASISYLGANNPEALPPALVVPNMTAGAAIMFFGSLLAPNVLVVMLIAITFAFWFLVLGGWIYANSRMLFAWSFDRVMPMRLSDVNDRTHTPVNAILVTLVAIYISVYLSIIEGGKYLMPMWGIAMVLIFGFSWLGTAIAAILFPFTKREIYMASPTARYKLAGIPALSVAGVIMLFMSLAGTYTFTTGPLGFQASSWYYVIGMIIVPCIIFYVVKAVRKRQGINLDLAFKEIPPE